MWLVKVIEYYFDMDLKKLGIYPRNFESLPGIFFTPFIHGDFKHLINNSMPIFLLMTAINYFYKKRSKQIIFLSWIFTGFSVWLGGRYAWHIGASGLIYAFFSFLFFSGILSKDRRLIAISLLIIFLYGGLIWGIFPTTGNISWESHLYGFFVGFILSFYLGKEFDTDLINKLPDVKEDFSETSSTHQNEYDCNYFFEDNK
jgi:membrane associated rhomboid family serine protease